jgi:phosphoenolpyruvate synthase/pyruvate phosphate dikinase
MKATYASLWNLRAVRERTYKRFDHRTASMGLSVQPSYKFKDDLVISSNSVLITRVVGTESVYGQQLSTQVGNGLVTNPVPDTRSELSIMTFDVKGGQFGISLLQYAKPKAGQPALNSMILSDQKMADMSYIARAIEVRYCEAKTLAVYYPAAKNCSVVVNSVKKSLALDMEFKNYSNGQILLNKLELFRGDNTK